jgi:F0F1-type ATP synthase assembly protein I
MIVLPIVAGILGGRLLDGALGTSPYATVVLLGLGICFSFVEAFRTISGALERIRRDRQQE